MAAARRALESVREHDPEVAALADRVAEVSYLLADVAADVASYSTSVETDPARLAAVSERRAALTALTRKYGETVDAGPRVGASCRRATASLDGSDERIAELRAERGELRADAGADEAAELTALRAKAGATSGKTVTGELHSLSMPHARFERRPRAASRTRRGLEIGESAGGSPRAASTRSSWCSRPTPAPSRGR